MITYNGIISYFKEFADKHLQINSFTQGSADKIDLKKINDYPVLHIDITGTSIQEKTIVFSVDVYIITASQSDDEIERVDALSSTLMIMQDLRAEFYEGKYIVPKLLLLRGSEELDCNPIEESFNNRVYGWSTSMSVTGINEATRCSIPYPLETNLLEQWNGDEFIPPFDSPLFGDYYWYSATEQVQGKLTYNVLNNIVAIAPIKSSNWLTIPAIVTDVGGGKPINYNQESQAIRLQGEGADYRITASVQTPTERYTYVAVKLKNIKSLDTENTSLIQVLGAGLTDGIHVFIGSPTGVETRRNKICLANRDETFVLVGDNISDGGNDYIREETLSIGLEIGGDDINSMVKVVMNGEVVLSSQIPTAPLDVICIGDNDNNTQATCSFDFQELYLHRHTGIASRLDDFIKVVDWLDYR